MAQKQVVGEQEHIRLQRALISLEGLAVGDAFGQRLLSDLPEQVHRLLETRLLPETRHGSWPYTGKTQMALSLVDCSLFAGQELSSHCLGDRAFCALVRWPVSP